MMEVNSENVKNKEHVNILLVIINNFYFISKHTVIKKHNLHNFFLNSEMMNLFLIMKFSLLLNIDITYNVL